MVKEGQGAGHEETRHIEITGIKEIHKEKIVNDKYYKTLPMFLESPHLRMPRFLEIPKEIIVTSVDFACPPSGPQLFKC